MICPGCSRELSESSVDGVTVDVCDGGCGGIWFDNYEVKKFDEPHESTGQLLLEVQRDPSIHVDHTQRRDCPKCTGQVMMRHFASVKHEVEIDECPACGGMWLDHGELGLIRQQYDSEAEQKAAAREYFQDLFGDQLKSMATKSDEDQSRSRRITGLFRFICPSYYISGDQDWGLY